MRFPNTIHTLFPNPQSPTTPFHVPSLCSPQHPTPNPQESVSLAPVPAASDPGAPRLEDTSHSDSRSESSSLSMPLLSSYSRFRRAR